MKGSGKLTWKQERRRWRRRGGWLFLLFVRLLSASGFFLETKERRWWWCRFSLVVLILGPSFSAVILGFFLCLWRFGVVPGWSMFTVSLFSLVHFACVLGTKTTLAFALSSFFFLVCLSLFPVFFPCLFFLFRFVLSLSFSSPVCLSPCVLCFFSALSV
jgi:hypothetical protein